MLVKGPASAIVLIKEFNKKIDFSDINEQLETNIPRRIQIAIVDADDDVVYYVAENVIWPETKMKEGQKSTIKDKDISELTNKGYQVNSGLKFGTHYRVYNYESKHAPWLIQKVESHMTWTDIARMVRVGHGVNKTIVLFYKKRWTSFEWIKP